jgi:hypothetical protein
MRRASSVSALRRLARLSWRDRALLAEAAVLLAVARLAVVVLPFRVIARRLGAHMAESPPTQVVADAQLRRIGWAIGAIAARTPWRSKCLEQGITAKVMLRRRGIPNTLYLGVARTEPGIVAHAWLRSGAFHVTGGGNVGGYAVVATFADAPE